MSTPTTVQGKSIPLAISLDDITYRNVVCSKAHEVTLDASINTEDTDCGRHASKGPNGLVMTFEGLLNTTVNGASEWSHDQILDIFAAETKVYMQTIPGARKIKGYGWIHNFVSIKATENLYSFSFTFTADGTPTITAV